MNAFNATDIPAGPSTRATGKPAGKGRASRKGDDLSELADDAAGENAERMPASGGAGEPTAALRGNDAVTMAQADIRADAMSASQGGSFAAPAAAGSFSPWMLGAIGLGAATAVAVSSRDHGATSNSNSAAPSVASASTIAATSTSTSTSTSAATDTATTTVKAPDVPVNTTPADTSGNIQLEVGVPARPASESTATVADAGGTVSSPANVTPAAGLIAPPVAQISGLYDDVGVRGEIINGTVTDDARPTLSGHAIAGTTVTVSDNDAVIGTTLASATGNWSFTPTTALTDGSHAFTVTVTDSTGLSSAASAPVRFTVIAAPAFVTLDEVLDNVGITTGPVGYGESTDDASPQLKGTATPGSTVDLYDGHGIADALADKIGTVVADGTGHWTYTPTLGQGLHDIYAHVEGTAGIANSSALQFTVTASPVVVTPVFVTLDGVFDDTGSGILVGIVRSTGDASPQLKGTATPGATVDLYDTHGLADAAADKIGTAVADSAGHWTYTPTLQQGLHGIYAYVGATTGTASSDVRDFVVTASPAFVTLDEVLDNVGLSTGLVAYGESTDDASPQLEGTATPGATVDLYDSHGLADASADKIGTVVADGAGHWTYTPALDPGLHGIYAHVSGTAGIATTFAHDFTVITAPTVVIPAAVTPAFVTLDEVLDNVGSSTGPVRYGESTDDASPQLTGTALPGATVDLYDSHGIADAAADKIGTVVADGAGHWTYTPALDQGLHGIYAYVGGAANVASTNAMEFFVDTSTLAARNTANSTVASLGKFDLSGNGDNTLKLSLDDLLSLGRTDLYVGDGKTQLMVNGDQGDAVEFSRLDGNWTSSSTATVAGEAYAVYQHSTVAAEVFIQHGVTAVLM